MKTKGRRQSKNIEDKRGLPRYHDLPLTAADAWDWVKQNAFEKQKIPSLLKKVGDPKKANPKEKLSGEREYENSVFKAKTIKQKKAVEKALGTPNPRKKNSKETKVKIDAFKG